MAEVFDSSGVYVKWFGSSVPTSVSATTVFQRFYRDGNISLEFKAENVVASTSKATGDTPILCEETGIFGHVHVNLLSQVQRGRYSIKWGNNGKIVAFSIHYAE